MMTADGEDDYDDAEVHSQQQFVVTHQRKSSRIKSNMFVQQRHHRILVFMHENDFFAQTTLLIVCSCDSSPGVSLLSGKFFHQYFDALKVT